MAAARLVRAVRILHRRRHVPKAARRLCFRLFVSPATQGEARQCYATLCVAILKFLRKFP